MSNKTQLNILKRANALFQQGKADLALEEYKKALALKPDDPNIRRIIAGILLKKNNISDAVKQYKWMADYYLEQGHLARTTAVYKRILRVAPAYEEVHLKLAELYVKQNLIADANKIYFSAAEKYLNRNTPQKALAVYKRILEYDNNNVTARLLIAENYLNLGMEKEAVDHYIVVADIFLNKKDYPETEKLLLNTLTKVKNTRLLKKLAVLYIIQGQDDQALDLLGQFNAEVFKSAELLKILAELYLKKNQADKAEKIYLAIIKKDPENTEILLSLGRIYLQKEKYDSTYRLFLPLVQKKIAEKNFDEAANLLRFITTSQDSYLPALTKLAEVYRLSGNTDGLISLCKSLIPIYEEKEMNEELKTILEELIHLTDKPLPYERQLAKLTGEEDNNAAGKTRAEIDNAEVNLADTIREIMPATMEQMTGAGDDVLMLSEAEQVTQNKPGPTKSKEPDDFVVTVEYSEDDKPGVFDIDNLGMEKKPAVQKPKETRAENQPKKKEDTFAPEAVLEELGIPELDFDSDEDLLKGESPFLDEMYFEIEKRVDDEIQSIMDFQQPSHRFPLPVQPGEKDKGRIVCSVFALPAAKKGNLILVQTLIYYNEKDKEAHLFAAEAYETAKRVGIKPPPPTAPAPNETELHFELRINGVLIRHPLQAITWKGSTTGVAFAVKIPENYAADLLTGTVIIGQNGAPLGIIRFRINVQPREGGPTPVQRLLPLGEAKIFRRAFVSYTHEDKEEIRRRMQTLLTRKSDYFQEIFTQGPVAKWEDQLSQKINQTDVFLLFWSPAAKNSQWVEKQISYALQCHPGEEEKRPEIIPVITGAPPPPELPPPLKHLHFNEKMLKVVT